MDQPKKRGRGRPPKMEGIQEEADTAGMLPLDYMLMVIRDKTATQTRRDRMAIAAAPYCHPQGGR